MSIVLIILCIGIIGLLVILIKLTKKNKEYESKYSKIIDINTETEKVKNELETIRSEFKLKKQIYDDLVQKVAIYDDEIELAELGFYKPIFDFDTPEKFKEQIEKVRDKQKQLVSSEKAIYCQIEWTVEGSKTKGKTFANRIIRLSSRAFNNECDAVIAKVKWNNIDKMIERIKKAYEAINKVNETNRVAISYEYLQLKLEELQLTYEYENKKQQEKEEQAEIRQRMREEAQLERDLADAEKEEEKYQKLLEKARKESEDATGEKLGTLNNKIKQLEEELKKAHEKSERAKSMAEQTKSGHVYVISNIGSFGENVYKIGMTRRLEPLDRVKELGDASVPFIFDVHAVIYSDNAPTLENKLHKTFDNKRVNLVNNKKEFFKISLNEIEKEVKKIAPNAEFIETIEAKEYKESLAIKIKQEAGNKASEELFKKFPDSI